MKFLVAVDAEGVAAVVGETGLGLTASRDFQFAKEQATREANAVARGLFAGGASEVIVWDNHGGSLNLDYRRIDDRCRILCGKGDVRRMSIIEESFDGLVLVGYHAMEGTIDGVLAHSFSSVTYQWMRANGREVGEIAIDAAIAGESEVPVVMVASDRAGCREALEFLPWVSTVETKRGLGRNMALSKSPAAVERELEETARSAAESLRASRGGEGPRPFTFAAPLSLELRYQRADKAESKSRSDPRFQRVDAFTVRAEGESITDFY